MKKTLILIFVLVVLGTAGWIYRSGNELPVAPFAKASRAEIANTLSTNGKVEPLDYVEVHAETPGLVKRMAVKQGDSVAAGQMLAELSQPGQADELQAAEARVAQAGADLATLSSGGRASDIADIEGSISRLRSDREAAQRTVDSLNRLVQKQAATAFELQQARDAVAAIDVQIRAQQARRPALVSKGDVDAAKAKLREAEVGVQAVRSRMGRNAITAPIGGVVYSLPAREGSWLNAGDLVGSVGKLDPVRVRVYVDEPELGRVAPGQSVRITWDALPAKEWHGTVEKRPTEVIALGSRQVGEVLCTIHNEGRDLIPGTSVNAFVLTQVAKNALSIPKTAVRRESGTGVYVLQKDGSIRWVNVKTGAADALNVEITEGLNEGDSVMLPSDRAFHDGDKLTARYQ